MMCGVRHFLVTAHGRAGDDVFLNKIIQTLFSKLTAFPSVLCKTEEGPRTICWTGTGEPKRI